MIHGRSIQEDVFRLYAYYYANLQKGLKNHQIFMSVGSPGSNPLQIPRDDYGGTWGIMRGSTQWLQQTNDSNKPKKQENNRSKQNMHAVDTN